jgi:hypothetical protein
LWERLSPPGLKPYGLEAAAIWCQAIPQKKMRLVFETFPCYPFQPSEIPCLFKQAKLAAKTTKKSKIP